jgi:hypothetical protein
MTINTTQGKINKWCYENLPKNSWAHSEGETWAFRNLEDATLFSLVWSSSNKG